MNIKVLSPGIFIPSNYGNMNISTVTLLEHGKKKMLVDTGGYGQRNQLIRALNNLGLSSEDITHVFLTHLHWDHFVNFDLFNHATFLISEEELLDLEGKVRRDIATPHQIRSMINSLNIKQIKNKTEILPYTTGLLTPGHTKGHMSLLVQTNNKKYCIAGDAVTNLESIHNASPSLAFYDLQAAKSSVEKIKSWADIIIPGHDSPLFRTENDSWIYFNEQVE